MQRRSAPARIVRSPARFRPSDLADPPRLETLPGPVRRRRACGAAPPPLTRGRSRSSTSASGRAPSEARPAAEEGLAPSRVARPCRVEARAGQPADGPASSHRSAGRSPCQRSAKPSAPRRRAGRGPRRADPATRTGTAQAGDRAGPTGATATRRCAQASPSVAIRGRRAGSARASGRRRRSARGVGRGTRWRRSGSSASRAAARPASTVHRSDGALRWRRPRASAATTTSSTHCSRSVPRRPSSATPTRKVGSSRDGGPGPSSSSRDRSVASGDRGRRRPAGPGRGPRSTCRSQPLRHLLGRRQTARQRAALPPVVGQGHGASWRDGRRAATSASRGAAPPSTDTEAGGRAVSRSRRLSATAKDDGDRFSSSTTVSPPSSATA